MGATRPTDTRLHLEGRPHPQPVRASEHQLMGLWTKPTPGMIWTMRHLTGHTGSWFSCGAARACRACPCLWLNSLGGHGAQRACQVHLGWGVRACVQRQLYLQCSNFENIEEQKLYKEITCCRNYCFKKKKRRKEKYCFTVSQFSVLKSKHLHLHLLSTTFFLHLQTTQVSI